MHELNILLLHQLGCGVAKLGISAAPIRVRCSSPACCYAGLSSNLLGSAPHAVFRSPSRQLWRFRRYLLIDSPVFLSFFLYAGMTLKMPAPLHSSHHACPWKLLLASSLPLFMHLCLSFFLYAGMTLKMPAPLPSSLHACHWEFLLASMQSASVP